MGSGTAHDLNEVPVLLSGVTVSFDVADNLSVGLGSGIETEGSLDIFVLKVAVDGLGAANDLDACAVRSHVLSQNCSVCIGIVTADDNDRCKTVLFSYLSYDAELLLCLEFGSAGTDDIKTAGISILIDILIIKNDIIIFK